MKKAIRYVIVGVLAFSLLRMSRLLEITYDAEGEIRWIPFVIFVLLAMYGGGWLDRKVLQRFLPD